MGRIVVGVTSSEHSRRVLEWAMREAAHHQMPLEVIAVRAEQVRPATRGLWAVPTYEEDSLNEDLARIGVHEFIEKVAAEIKWSGPEFTVTVAKGDAVEELARASRDADLLVVGSGATGFARILAGSISDQVVHHASCPVVVIPERDRPAHSAEPVSRMTKDADASP